VAEGARLGPDLTHVGSRMHIGAGTLRTHRNTLQGWIADPQAAKPGVFMPGSQDLDRATLQALATYLEHLK
jgi:cytochrome c oxidase subunit 2